MMYSIECSVPYPSVPLKLSKVEYCEGARQAITTLDHAEGMRYGYGATISTVQASMAGFHASDYSEG